MREISRSSGIDFAVLGDDDGAGRYWYTLVICIYATK
jgi:hypothetical protein